MLNINYICLRKIFRKLNNKEVMIVIHTSYINH